MGELYSRCLGQDWHQLLSQGEWGCCGSWGGSGVSESSVLNQTNTVEFLPLLVQRVEWQGCIAEVPVSRNNSRSKCDHPLRHSIFRLSHVAYFKINLYKTTEMHIYSDTISCSLDSFLWIILWKWQGQFNNTISFSYNNNSIFWELLNKWTNWKNIFNLIMLSWDGAKLAVLAFVVFMLS